MPLVVESWLYLTEARLCKFLVWPCGIKVERVTPVREYIGELSDVSCWVSVLWGKFEKF